MLLDIQKANRWASSQLDLYCYGQDFAQKHKSLIERRRYKLICSSFYFIGNLFLEKWIASLKWYAFIFLSNKMTNVIKRIGNDANMARKIYTTLSIWVKISILIMTSETTLGNFCISRNALIWIWIDVFKCLIYKGFFMSAFISHIILLAIERTTKDEDYKSPFSLISPLIFCVIIVLFRDCIIHSGNREFVIWKMGIDFCEIFFYNVFIKVTQLNVITCIFVTPY